jgi:hypothetical protein
MKNKKEKEKEEGGEPFFIPERGHAIPKYAPVIPFGKKRS